MNATQESVYRRSLAEPEQFWAEAAEAIDWERRWDKVLDADGAPFYRWFAGGVMNTCYNALDRHLAAGAGDRIALIHDSPVTGSKKHFTYAQLTDVVARFAGALAARGVGRGDRVVIYMPMVPEAAIAMLACARLGAVHSVVFGGFAANELAVRIDDCGPKAIIAGSCGIEPGPSAGAGGSFTRGSFVVAAKRRSSEPTHCPARNGCPSAIAQSSEIWRSATWTESSPAFSSK